MDWDTSSKLTETARHDPAVFPLDWAPARSTRLRLPSVALLALASWPSQPRACMIGSFFFYSAQALTNVQPRDTKLWCTCHAGLRDISRCPSFSLPSPLCLYTNHHLSLALPSYSMYPPAQPCCPSSTRLPSSIAFPACVASSRNVLPSFKLHTSDTAAAIATPSLSLIVSYRTHAAGWPWFLSTSGGPSSRRVWGSLAIEPRSRREEHSSYDADWEVREAYRRAVDGLDGCLRVPGACVSISLCGGRYVKFLGRGLRRRRSDGG